MRRWQLPGRRGHAFAFLGNYERAIQDATAAMKLAEGKDDMQIPFANVLRLRGLANRFNQGRSLEAAEDLEEALSVYVRLGDSFRIPHLLMETAMVRAALGESAERKPRMRKRWLSGVRAGTSSTRRNLLNNYGFLKYQLGE